MGLTALLVKAEVLLAMSRSGDFNARKYPCCHFGVGKSAINEQKLQIWKPVFFVWSRVLEGHLILFINSFSWLSEEEKSAAELF